MPPLLVPVAVKVELKEELNPLESLEEIRREYEPTEWVASMVATQKLNGKIRFYIDQQHLNQALKCRHHPLPVVEDILPELSKGRVLKKTIWRMDSFRHNLTKSTASSRHFRPLREDSDGSVCHLVSAQQPSVSNASSTNALRDLRGCI